MTLVHIAFLLLAVLLVLALILRLVPKDNSKTPNTLPGGLRAKMLLWQVLATAGLLAASISLLYFRYLRHDNRDVAHWPLSNWVLVALVAGLSLWAGPGTAKLVLGFIQDRANAKARDEDDQQARNPKRARTTWFEWQMIDASWVAIAALSVITNGLALVVGIYALAVCKHQQARKKAMVLTVLGGCITLAGLLWGLNKSAN